MTSQGLAVTRSRMQQLALDDDITDSRQKAALKPQLVHNGVSLTHVDNALAGFGVGRHEDDLRLRPFVLDAPRQLQSVEAGHEQVRDHDVGAFAPYEGEGLLPIRRLAHDGNRVGQRCKEEADEQAVVRVVIRYDNGDRRRRD